MGLLVGFIPAGRVDDVDGEAVHTTFALIGLPLIPVGSHVGGFSVGLNLKSVLAGYVRWWCPLLVFLSVMLDHGRWSTPHTVLALVWASSFLWGRASARTLALRGALLEATRVPAEPRRVDDACLRATYRQLVREARRGELTLPSAYALAVYHLELAPRSPAAARVASEAERALRGRPFDQAALRAAQRHLLQELDAVLAANTHLPLQRRHRGGAAWMPAGLVEVGPS